MQLKYKPAVPMTLFETIGEQISIHQRIYSEQEFIRSRRCAKIYKHIKQMS